MHLNLQRIKEKCSHLPVGLDAISWVKTSWLGLHSTRRKSISEVSFWSVPTTEIQGAVHLLTKVSVSLIEFSRSESCFRKTGLQSFTNEVSLSFALGYRLWIIRNGRDAQINLWRKQNSNSICNTRLFRIGVSNMPTVHPPSWGQTAGSCLEEWNLSVLALLSVLWKGAGGGCQGTQTWIPSLWQYCKFFLLEGSTDIKWNFAVISNLKWNMIPFPICYHFQRHSGRSRCLQLCVLWWLSCKSSNLIRWSVLRFLLLQLFLSLR